MPSRIGSRSVIVGAGAPPPSASATNCSSRETRPSQGSAFVARHSAAGSDDDASPSTSGRNGVKMRPLLARERRQRRRERRRAAAPRRCRSPPPRRPGRQPRAEHPLLAALVARLQEQRRLLRAAVDRRRWRAARRRRSGRRTGCSAAAPVRRAARSCPAGSRRRRRSAAMTLARRAANSSDGKISAPVKTGCAAQHGTAAVRRRCTDGSVAHAQMIAWPPRSRRCEPGRTVITALCAVLQRGDSRARLDLLSAQQFAGGMEGDTATGRASMTRVFVLAPLLGCHGALVTAAAAPVLEDSLVGRQVFPRRQLVESRRQRGAARSKLRGLHQFHQRPRRRRTPPPRDSCTPTSVRPPYGIPYVVVSGDQPLVAPTWTAYGSESDNGAPGRPPGYPIPDEAKTHGRLHRRRRRRRRVQTAIATC